MEIAKTVTMISSPASSEDQVYEVKEDTPLFYPLAKRVAAPNVGKKPKSGAKKSHAGQKPKKTKHPSNAIGRPSAASPPTAYALEKPLWVFGTRGKECGGEFMFPYGIAVNNEGNIVIAGKTPCDCSHCHTLLNPAITEINLTELNVCSAFPQTLPTTEFKCSRRMG